jgi:uncharacterized protein
MLIPSRAEASHSSSARFVRCSLTTPILIKSAHTIILPRFAQPGRDPESSSTLTSNAHLGEVNPPGVPKYARGKLTPAATKVKLSKMETLNPVEVRVLGALLEKDMVTPEYYPLTLHSLQAACNQKSNREPVVNYDEDTVFRAIELSRNRGLVIRVTGAGHRVEKVGHRLGEKLNLGRRELALLCVLMLRGPQTVGELRARTERMHDFTDLEEVERCLESLATREPDALVMRALRGRWAQLFGGHENDGVEESAGTVGRSPIEQGIEERMQAVEREVAQLKQQFEDFRRQFQ